MPWRTVLGRIRPAPAAACALLAGLLVSPLVHHQYDVVDCFLTWSRASHGRAPWAIYLTRFKTDCDYPPVVPYLLTAVEAARLALGAAPAGAMALMLVKLPNLLAWMAHVPLVAVGLRRPFGAPVARRAAVLAALSLPLLVNAAAWGQFDALLSLFLVAAVVAALHGRSAWAGAALGCALATKLLAVVLAPVLAVWLWRTRGLRAVLVAGVAAALVMAVIALPMATQGATGPVLSAYRGAVGYYTFRTGEAYNVWYLLDRFDIAVRGILPWEAKDDTRTVFGPVTHRHVGLTLFAGCALYLLRQLARRTSPYALVAVAALAYFAFFMLPTQMHQRYLLPAAVLAGLIAPVTRRAAWLFAGLTATATLNQALDLFRAVLDQSLLADPSAVANPALVRNAIRLCATTVALGNVALFGWAMITIRRELDDAPPTAYAAVEA